ncbi:MAG: pilus assembly PilX family protein [Candidatus Zixiibacteriota bacterium]
MGKCNNQSGFATLIALLMVGMLTLLGLAVLSTTDDEVTIAGNELQEMRAFYAAEAGLDKAASMIQEQYENTGVPPTIMPTGTEDLNQCQVTYVTTDDGAATQEVLSTGSLAGLHALVKSFTINSTAQNSNENAKILMSQTFETALVPIFQFAVFYGNDLEIAPGADMNLIGRVHSNGDLYMQAASTLRMDSYVTSSGNMYHGRKGPGSVDNGDVLIKDASGNYQSMKQGSGWLDAYDSYWYDTSVYRWNGRVQDAAHGQQELNLPLTNAADPHKIIERETSNPDSYESLATIKFIDGQAYEKVSGTWVNVTADMLSKNIISVANDKFYDGRELDWVDCYELDIEKLYDEGYGPSNGVIYFSDDIAATSEFPALRINNGDELDAGLTIVSENPVYFNGDYNTVDKKPSAVMADAVTFLSNNWDASNYDSKSTMTKSNRPASETTVNVSYVTGNVETTSTVYSGGFENLPRFLEVWSGINFNWSGSAVNLWNSAQANGSWNGTYYSPPIRNWAYDTDLDDPNKLPPETPVVRVFQRTGWQQQYVGYTE